MIKNIIQNLLLATLIVVLLSFQIKADESNRKLEINLSKSKYLVYEPIWLDVFFKNVSNDSLSLPWICLECRDGSLEIELKDSKGKFYEYTGMIWNVSHGEISKHKYGPQEGIFTTYNLLESNGSYINGSFYPKSLPPEMYSIRLCRGSNCSELINFEIIEPNGSEEKALKLLMDGFHATHFKKFKERIDFFKLLIDDYSSSVYAPKALLHIGMYPTQKEAEEILNIENLSIELLQRYPNSGYNFGLIRGLRENRFLPDEVEVIEAILKENKNNRIGKLNKQMLQDKNNLETEEE